MTRLRSIFVFTLATFAALFLSLVPLILATSQTSGWAFTRQILFLPVLTIPLLAYLIIGSAVIGLLVTIGMRLVVTRIDRQQREALRLVLQSNYQAADQHAEYALSRGVTAQMKQLNEKLLSLQQELQVYSSQPPRFEGETKEEILVNERHRLARELHDSVSQQLFAAMMMLSALNETAQAQEGNDRSRQMITRIERVVNEAQSEMRALLLHLRPTSLEGRSLKEGIIQLLKELQTKIKIKITWDMDDVHLKSGVEDNLFRIVQELLSNTLRHAHADQMQVFLKKVEQEVVLRVVDNGVGFDMKQQEKAGSYGLNNIHERVESMGGTVRTISFKNEGTSVEIRVPIVMEAAND